MVKLLSKRVDELRFQIYEEKGPRGIDVLSARTNYDGDVNKGRPEGKKVTPPKEKEVLKTKDHTSETPRIEGGYSTQGSKAPRSKEPERE